MTSGLFDLPERSSLDFDTVVAVTWDLEVGLTRFLVVTSGRSVSELDDDDTSHTVEVELNGNGRYKDRTGKDGLVEA